MYLNDLAIYLETKAIPPAVQHITLHGPQKELHGSRSFVNIVNQVNNPLRAWHHVVQRWWWTLDRVDPHEQQKNGPGCLGYIEDYTTQL